MQMKAMQEIIFCSIKMSFKSPKITLEKYCSILFKLFFVAVKSVFFKVSKAITKANKQANLIILQKNKMLDNISSHLDLIT